MPAGFLSLLLAAHASQAQDWNGFWVQSANGGFSTRVLGRLHLDYTQFQDDQAILNNGSEIRRLRLDFQGTLFSDLAYKAQFELAGGNPEIRDLYLQHKPSGISLGQFKTPLSLEEQGSSNAFTFTERGLPTAFVTSRRLGLGWDRSFEQGTIALMAYDHATDGGDEAPGIGGRVTWTPWRNDDHLLHLGLGALLEGPDDDIANTLRIRARSEVSIGPRLVDTGIIEDVDDVTKLGLEAAWQKGPWSVQSEYIETDVETGASELSFSSFYLYGSYFLTGQSRSYRDGKFGRIRMAGEKGAWQIALRYSHLDLEEAGGGELDDWTLGLNYYFTPHVRVLTNLILANSSRNGLNDEPTALQVRMQVDF